MKKDNSTKSNTNWIKKVLLTLLIILLSILLIISSWFIFCLIDRKPSYNAITEEYSVYVRTDALWDAVNPLMDLQAAEILLADPALSNVRTSFLEFRKSPLRNNFWIKKALNRRVDITLYNNQSALAVVDSGFLAGAVRLAPIALSFVDLGVPELTYVKDGSQKYFKFENELITVYAAIRKNLIIASNDKTTFDAAYQLSNHKVMQPKHKIMKEKLNQSFMIAADTQNLISMIENLPDTPKEGEKPEETAKRKKNKEQLTKYIELMKGSLANHELSTIKFNISDTDIDLMASVVFNFSEELQSHPLANLICRSSTIPTLLSKLPGNVQYYTFINAGSLEELKDVAASLLPEKTNFDSLWSTGENASKVLFNLSLEELLFSWTDSEFGVCGLENKAEPVFAIKVSDESKRQEIFNNVLSSIILKSDDSLLIDGMRLPRIEVPVFLQNLLSALGINIPKPYFLVKDNYIYFSQSPDNLVSVNSAKKSNTKLIYTKNWEKVSTLQDPTSTVSLFYNLERSIPFFLQNKSTFSEILKLYNIGRVDLCTKDNKITVQLQATALQTPDSKIIPGFPLSFENMSSSLLYQSKTHNTNQVYFIEGSNIHALNLSSLEDNIYTLEGISSIVPANPETSKANKGELWAITKDGSLYLFDKTLNVLPGFPIFLDKNYRNLVAFQDSVLYTQIDTGTIFKINPKAEIEYISFELGNTIQSEPVTLNKSIAIYDRGFFGNFVIKTGEKESSSPLMGIGFGSPVLYSDGGLSNLAFITQSGTIYTKKFTATSQEDIYQPFVIDDVFYLNLEKGNLKNSPAALFALGETGTIYRITGNEYTKTKIPYLNAKEGYITCFDCDDDGNDEIFICGEGNTIYGFRENLDMLEGFPVSGYGKPVFADVNGDNKKDCLVLSLDKKLYAYKIQ